MIGWLSFRATPAVEVWSNPGFVVDFCATAFLLPFFVTTGTSLVVWYTVKTGRIAPITSAPVWLRRLPARVLPRAFVLASLGLLVSAPPMFCWLYLTGETHVALLTLISIKALWSGVLAAVVTPIVALCMMMEATP